MKRLQKIFLGLLTLVLSFSFILGVKADTLGSIKVDGTVKDRTYEIYKIFDLTYSGTNVSYTIDSDWEDFFNNQGKDYISDTDLGSLNQITIGSQTKYINITEENINEFTSLALTYASTLEGNDGSIKESDTDKTLTFTNLDLGYYLVYPKGATDVLPGYASICSITSTMSDAVVNIKATYPTIEKEVDYQNVEVGQYVKFTITGLVPDTTGFTSYTYQIDDMMSAGLKLDSTTSNFTIKFGEETITATPTYHENGFTLTFDMVNYQDYVGDVITITYDVLVEEDAVLSDDTKNSATLTYSNDPKSTTTYTTPPVEIPVYSSPVPVITVDSNDEEIKLEGASFVIKNQEGLYYQAIGANGIITNTNTTEGIIDVVWVENKNEATILTTEEDGIITFKGLKNGTYYLEEIEAPLGYNKLTGPVTLKVGYEENATNLVETAVNHEEIVKNATGTALPETGGVGTKIFIIVGSILFISSGIILITNKRFQKQN